MWTFLSSWFGPRPEEAASVGLGTGGKVGERNRVGEKVEQIESHLNDKKRFPHSHGHSHPYNLIDWNIKNGPRGPVGLGGPAGSGGTVERVSPIYLGSVLALTDPSFTNHIGAVVSIIDPGRMPKEVISEMLRPGTAHLYLPLDDEPRAHIAKYLEPSAKFIKYYQDRGVPVFIHCMAGMSRSATLAAYYLMKKYNINAIKALDLLKKRRPIIRPNPGFIRQLVEQEN